MTLNDMTPFEEVTLKTLLGHQWGDGIVSPEGRYDRALLKQAVRLGLVDANGYLTDLGRRFLAERSHNPGMQTETSA